MTDIGDDRVVEQTTQQPDEVEALRQENEKLKKQLEETMQTLKIIQDELANIRKNSGAQSGENPPSGAENPDAEEVNLDKLYKFGNSSLEKNEVKNVLQKLKEPYKTEILKFIKENQIKELQDYLNNLIDENVINKSELRRVCEGKGIWIYENGHILNDGKFGPQTMEAIRMLEKTGEEVREESNKDGEKLQETIGEKDEFENVKVKEEVDVPEVTEVEAGDLVEELPEGATVEFKEGKGVDKMKEGEEQEVTVIVKMGEKVKEIVIIVKIEDGKIKIKEKEEEKKEDEEIPEKSRLDALTIDDLGVWDLNGNGKFEFESGLINEKTKELTVKHKTIPMIEDGGEGFGYVVKDGLVRIGNIKNGVLDGYGVEFFPYGDDLKETENYNDYGIKMQGEWKEGELKDGLEIVRESGLNIDIEIKEGKPTKVYSEDESISVDFENREDGLYLKNKNSTLKLKNKYSSVQILKILHDYKDKEGSFSTDLSEGHKSKKLIWTPADGGEKKVVYGYADNLISDEIFESEGLRLSGWLNEYRETHQEFKLEEYGEFNSERKFVFKDGVEKTDENGKKYIEYNKEKYYEYEEGINGLGYDTGKNDKNIGRVYLGNFVNGKSEGKGIIAWSDGDRYEGEWKDDKKEGKGTYFWADGGRYEGEWKDDKKEGKGIMIRVNGNRFEGEYKEDKIEKGKFTLVTPEEIAGEYEVQRDEKGLRIVSGEHEGKYINEEEGKIEEKVDNPEDETGKESWVEAFSLEEIGEINSDGGFVFKEGVEKTDEDSKTYIEVGGEKFYKDSDEGYSYYLEGGMFGIGKCEKGNSVGYWIEYDWEKQEGEYNSEGNRDGEWKMTTPDGKKGGGKYENGNKVGKRVEYYQNGDKSEGEYNSEGKKEGEWIVIKADGTEEKWVYENGNGKKKGEETKEGDGDEGETNESEKGKEYKIDRVKNIKVKHFVISSFDELPSGYKRDDPEKYDESNEDTYPKVYSLQIDGREYYFYSNGRCKSPEGMVNTKDVVEKIQENSKES